MVFSLASGNIAGAFDIVTTNDSIGEVFVARPLDREELDHYILKVGTPRPPAHPLPSASVDHPEELGTPWQSSSCITGPQWTQSRKQQKCPSLS